MYHPDKGGVDNLNNICDIINQVVCEKLLLLGDFNLRNIDWKNCETSPKKLTDFS